MKFRVLWKVDFAQKTMAIEYKTRPEAEDHRRDIAGWCPEAWIEEIYDETEPRKGPFEV